MNTVWITLSPKPKGSNSGYLARLAAHAAGGGAQQYKLRGPKDYDTILAAAQAADVLVLACPLYIDALPSHAVTFLQQAESRLQGAHCRVYAILNCGFYEGRQCELALEMLRCWCLRTGLTWGGGVGTGAGEMLGAIRSLPAVGAAVSLVLALLCGVPALMSGTFGAAMLKTILGPCVGCTLAYLLFSGAVLRQLWRLGHCIRKQAFAGAAFPTVSCCPALLFVAFANLFWLLLAAVRGTPVWRLFYRMPSACPATEERTLKK